jgi:hypothetical protein
LVVAGGVEGEVSEQLAGGLVDDADLEVVDQEQDVGAGVGAADADVVESAGVAEGDGACFVDLVAADAAVVVGAVAFGLCFGEALVGDGGSGPGEGAVGAAVVVLVDEVLEEALEVGEGGGGGSGSEPALEGLLEAFDLSAGSGWLGREFFWVTPRRVRVVSKPLRPPRPPAKRVVKTMPLSVRTEAGMPAVATVWVKASTTAGPVTRRWAVTVRA